MGHGMSRFTLEPGSPNFPAPGKRMQHNMSPIVITKNGQPAGALGLPGGRMIVSVSAQLALGALDFKASAHEIVYAPRVHTDGGEPVAVSESMPEPVAAALTAMGHQLKRERVAGPSNLAIIDPATGKIDSASGRTLKLE
jgi:gamma-glutamyltranspeptidase / glutathione hydrolase